MTPKAIEKGTECIRQNALQPLALAVASLHVFRVDTYERVHGIIVFVWFSARILTL